MVDVKAKVEQINALVADLKKNSKQLILEVGVEWLNSPENTEGYTIIGFGGYTPSFNDGELCVFSMKTPWGIKLNEGVDEDDIEWTPYIHDYISEEGEGVSDTLRVGNPFRELVKALDSVGIIQQLFNEYGFVFILRKDGTYEEKEYDCGY